MSSFTDIYTAETPSTKIKRRYHYTYWITNIVLQKHYIGVRTSVAHPSKDIGKIYFSSSTDKEFIEIQNTHPQNFEYRICSIFQTRELAVLDEIEQHRAYDVGRNPRFFNKAKQTSTGFDTGDTKGALMWINNGTYEKMVQKDSAIEESWINGRLAFSEETKKNMNLAKGKIWISNGTDTAMIFATDEIPDGWRKNRGSEMIGKSRKHFYDNKRFINNGKKNKMIDKDAELPDGWFENRIQYEQTDDYKKNMSERIKGRIFITNGKNTKSIYPDEEFPIGYYKGTSFKKREKLQWCTNGVISKMLKPSDSLPDGFRYGRK